MQRMPKADADKPKQHPLTKPMRKGARIAAGLITEAEARKEVGAPTAYKSEFADQAERMCLLGLTNEELAVFFKVSPVTITSWINDIPEFARALFEGREGADHRVARALYLRACGYEHPEDDIRTVSMGGNQGSEIVITPTVKRYAPDTGAAALWLSNRQRKRWTSNPSEGGGSDPAQVAQLMREMAAAADDDAAES